MRSNEGQFGEIIFFSLGVIPHRVVSFGGDLGELLVNEEFVGNRRCLPTAKEDIDVGV